MDRYREFQQKVDLPAILGQFLADAKLEDLVVELVQNELDAGSSKTTIHFTNTALICEGDGRPIDEDGWNRLEMLLGAGGRVPAKQDGIGAKNHGLRTGFWLGDEIAVQSNGERVDLVLFRVPKSRVLDPGVWPRVADSAAPARGVRITIPYRTRNVPVPSGEGFDLPPPTLGRLRSMFDDAISDAPRRLISTVLLGRDYELELVWRDGETHAFAFECKAARLRNWPGLLRRSCREIVGNVPTKILVDEAVIEFPIILARGDHSKVPRFFKRAAGLVGELSWALDAKGRPKPCDGKLRYPISYPDHAPGAYSGHGFHVSAPFISDTTRHGLVSSNARNDRLIEAARNAAAKILRGQLLPRYGPGVLSLVRRPGSPDPRAEATLTKAILAAKALLVVPRIDRRLGRARLASRGSPVVVAHYADVPNEVAPALIRLAPSPSQLLSPGTPEYVAAALLTINDPQVSAWTDLDAIQSVIPASPAVRQARESSVASAVEVRDVVDRLSLVQRASDRGALPGGLADRLLDEALLPTATGQWVAWRQTYFSRQLAPIISGLSTPPTVHSKLVSLRVLREGPLKLPRFRVDAHLGKASLSTLLPASKEAFFAWLAKNHAELSPATLKHLADEPVWPSALNGFMPLNTIVAAKDPRLTELLTGSIATPREDLLAFPGLRRNARGALYLRPWPSEVELRSWYDAQTKAIVAMEADDLVQAQSLVRRLELDLVYLLSVPRLADLVPSIAADHRTLDAAGHLAPVRRLHDCSIAVRVCDLLPSALTGGPHRELYLRLDAKQRPDPDAVLQALQSQPTTGDTLFRRLQAFAQHSNAALLADCAIIPIDGQLRRPVDLCLPHPQNLDLWGTWKCLWHPPGLTPDRFALLVECGIARFLTDALSAGFFKWLGGQGSAVQAQHLPQALRHLRDRQRGPLHWWSGRPTLACLPVRGFGDEIEFVSFSRATNPRGPVFLPDFPELHTALLDKDRTKRLVITDVEGVTGTLFTPLRGAGVRSLRRVVGRPRALTAIGVATSGGQELETILQRLRSERMIHELPKRLELHGGSQDDLRGSWRSLLRNLTGVRLATELRATFEFSGRNYELAFGAGVDSKTGLVWLDGRRAASVQLFEAIGGHLFDDSADPLAPYALMRAVEMPFESAGKAGEVVGREGEDEYAPLTVPPLEERPAIIGIDVAAKGHGLSEAERVPVVPQPAPLNPIAPTPRATHVSHNRRKPSRPRSGASTDHLRGSVAELEQTLRLKQDHYAWHCQACLGDHDVAAVTPPDTYVSLAKYRQGLIEAHHVQHLQNAGGLGAANLVSLCSFHHDLIGDQLSPEALREALLAAEPTTRAFPTDKPTPYSLDGYAATLPLDVAPHTVRLFFTEEHRAAWLRGAKA